MGKESIIELIQRRITPMDSEKGEANIARTFHKDDYKSLDIIIEALKCGEENEKLLNRIKFIAGFNITVDSERKEVIAIIEESIKNRPETRMIIKIER